MNVENGEKLRVCAVKKRREQERFLSHARSNPTNSVNGAAPATIAYNNGYRPKSDSDLACPEDCPGTQITQRKLGPIPLPVSKEVCPMEAV